MYEVEIEYPDGSKTIYLSFDHYTLMRALDKCEIKSFTIRLRTIKIAPNPLTKKP